MPTYPLTGTNDATVEARLNVMRLAQTRMGYMDPVLRLTISGTDRTTKADKQSIRITRPAEGPATASLKVYGFTPVQGGEIKIGIGAIGNLIFAGHIVKATRIAPVNMSQSRIWYSLQCQDYSWLLNKRQIMQQFDSDNVESIISTLVSTYATGFTTNHVNQGLKFLTGPTPFTMETLEGGIRRLAKQADAYSYIDYTKDVHFFAAGQDRAPQPHDLTTAYTDFERVTLETDLSQIVTRMYGEGAGSTIATTDTYPNPVVFSFTVADFSMFPETGVFDIRVGGYAPMGATRFRASRGGAADIDFAAFAGTDSTTDFEAMRPFPIGTEIQIWRVLNDVAAQAALAALDGSDGIREGYLQDRRLSDDGLTSALQGEIDRRKNPLDVLRYRTHDPCSRPGAQITVSLSAPTSISGTFTIQEVVITDIETAVGRHPWYDVTATSNRRTLWDLLSPRGAVPGPLVN